MMAFAQGIALAVVEVPTEAGTHWPGQSLAPQAFRDCRLQDKLAALGYKVDTTTALKAGPEKWVPTSVVNGVRNEAATLRVMREVREHLSKEVLDPSNRVDGPFPIILGGDCSISPAVFSSVCHAYPHSRVGLLYVDNDADLTLPSETSAPGMQTLPQKPSQD